MLEVFGYLASLVTVSSLMMSNIWRLRWLNLVGALALMVYSWALGAWPLVARALRVHPAEPDAGGVVRVRARGGRGGPHSSGLRDAGLPGPEERELERFVEHQSVVQSEKS